METPTPMPLMSCLSLVDDPRRAGYARRHDLQEILLIQAGSLSEIVGKLEAKGYLTKERDAQDQRKLILKVTPKGRKTPEEKQYIKSREELFSSLSDPEQKQLKKLLQKLLEDWLNIDEGGTN